MRPYRHHTPNMNHAYYNMNQHSNSMHPRLQSLMNMNRQRLMDIPTRDMIPLQFQRPFFMNQPRPLLRNQHAPNHRSPPMLQNQQPLMSGLQRGKRPMTQPSHSDESKRKRSKPNDAASSTEDQFIVPCSEGTEQITVSMWEYFLSSKMSDEDLEKKLMLQKTLHSIIKESFPDSRLFIVGSSMTGFATRSSDVDMCLVISDKEIDQKREAPVILTALMKSLRSCSFVQRPQVIRAKVPILKFTDRVSGFECDLNINNTIGIRNTHLLRYYSHMDWRVRPIMLFIKMWARFHDINDASKRTISSYSLSLMLVHYLQGVKPAVLPCLQTLKPKLFSTKNDIRKLALKMEDIGYKSSNTATLGELFLGFLDYYSNVFSYEYDIISVRRGRKVTRDDVGFSDWKFLCIEEPFDGTNTARSVYDHFVFMRILRVFLASFNTLKNQRNTPSILQHPF